MFAMVMKTLLSFALIIFLMVVVFQVIRRFYLPLSSSSNSLGSLRVYGQLQIQPKKSIYIVRVLNKVLILGVSENSINVLSEISDQEMIRVLDEIYVSGEKRNGKVFKAKPRGEF